MRKEFIHSKEDLRTVLLERRKRVSDKLVLSAKAAARIINLVYGNVLVYSSIGSELDTSGLINMLLARDDVCVYTPYTQGAIITPRRIISQTKADKNGNLPEWCYEQKKGISADKIDFCITPLVGFNAAGYRIGYGKGCYDRYFESDKYSIKIGLAFECQKVNFKPDPYDLPLDCCVTEQKVIYF